MQWITDKDPIKHINTHPTKEEVSKCVENAIYSKNDGKICRLTRIF